MLYNKPELFLAAVQQLYNIYLTGSALQNTPKLVGF